MNVSFNRPEDEDTPENLLEAFLKFLDDFKLSSRGDFRPRTVWDRLASDGNFELISKLQMVEKGYPGYGTVVVPAGGFSEDDDTHNAVLDWLRGHHINVLNPGLLITKLERALHWRSE